jgi:hypothetical protein
VVIAVRAAFAYLAGRLKQAGPLGGKSKENNKNKNHSTLAFACLMQADWFTLLLIFIISCL